MEAGMQHYQAAGFSEEASRLVVATRRPSTNRMYKDRWLRFAHYAAAQGFDALSPTAAQIATFLYSLFDTHDLSPQTATGPAYPQFLTTWAKRQWCRTELSPT